MRSLTLTEYKASDPLPLSAEERRALLQISSLHLDATPAEGVFTITPGSEIGVVELPTLRVTIEPKLPIDRVLFLVSYSLDPVRWSEDATYASARGLVEWLVHVFIRHARHAIERGLIRGYREEEDSLTTIRGRLRFDEQVRRRFGAGPPAEVRYDEYTEDVDLNRVVKAAGRRLGRMHLCHPQSRRALLQLDVAFDRVRDVVYAPRALPQITFTRLNDHYRTIWALAELVLSSASLTLGEGRTQGRAFLVDMNRVFEDFVVTALREALRLSRRQFPQGAAGRRLYLAQGDRVTLRPDISWWDGSRCVFVGDVKYKRIDLTGYREADLYQLLAYTVAADLPGGILVYAKGERPEGTYVVRHAAKRLEVVALTLDGTPEQVLAEIDDVAERIRRLRRRAYALAA